MFIILKKDDWDILNIVKNCFDKPKLFSCESEAIDFCKEMEITEFQIVEVTI